MIAGVDEAGRGPLAGPVVAAAVILCPEGIDGLADSKTLARPVRERVAALIRARCRVGVGFASVAEIDRLNILWATMLAMQRAVAALGGGLREILVDGNRCPDLPAPARAIVGGDATEPSISAASIVAKVARDRHMAMLHRRHPQFGWARNAGYGVPEHLAAMETHGITEHHRRSFAPVARLCRNP